jgi:hypothetical protein
MGSGGETDDAIRGAGAQNVRARLPLVSLQCIVFLFLIYPRGTSFNRTPNAPRRHAPCSSCLVDMERIEG